MIQSIVSNEDINNFLSIPVHHTRFKEAVKKLRFAISTAGEDPISQCIYGPPGSGKTFAANFVTASFPPKYEEEISTFPVIYISMRSKSLTKDIYKQILKEMNIDITQYNNRDLRDLVIQQLKICGVKLIIIDEFHHLVRNDKLINVSVCDAIKKIIDDSNVPVALLGTERGIKLFKINDEIKDRFSEPYSIEPMSVSKSGSNDYFQAFIRRKMASSPMRSVDLSERDNSLRLLLATGGSLRKFRYLMRNCIRINRKTPERVLSLKDYQEAFELTTGSTLRTPNGDLIRPFLSDISLIKRELGIYGKSCV